MLATFPSCRWFLWGQNTVTSYLFHFLVLKHELIQLAHGHGQAQVCVMPSRQAWCVGASLLGGQRQSREVSFLQPDREPASFLWAYEAVVVAVRAPGRERGEPRRPSRKGARGAEDRWSRGGWVCHAEEGALEPARQDEAQCPAQPRHLDKLCNNPLSLCFSACKMGTKGFKGPLRGFNKYTFGKRHPMPSK